MKSSFKFYQNESKIYDYLFFPSMIHCKLEKGEDKDNYEDEVSEDFKKLWILANSRLKPYQNVLSKYYLEDISLIFLLCSGHSFFKFDSIDDYLNHLMTLDDREILKTIIYSLQLKESNDPPNKEAMDLAEAMIRDDSKLMTWINTLSYNGETKWQLLCFSKAPGASLGECIQILRAIEPVFNEFYEPHEERIRNYGEMFIEKLNSAEGDALNGVTNGIVKDSSIPGDPKRFIISYFNGYSIQITTSSIPGFVAWGINIESFVKEMLKKNENQLQERLMVFKNLSDKTRYEVLKCIAKGITSTKVIAKQLGVSSATISYHLSNLATSKLIVLLQQEGHYYYEINHNFIEQCFADLKKDLQP